MELGPAAVHAALDGIATVLPLSSSGHRFAAQLWLGSGAGLDQLAQASRIGILVAVLIAVWSRLTGALAAGIRGIARPASGQKTREATTLLVATLAAATTELALQPLTSPLNESWVVVGASLMLTAAAIGSTALVPAPRHTCPGSIAGVLGGVAYGLAVVPGTSPVAMTFVVFRWLGVSSYNAMELTLALCVPLLALSSARELFAAPSASSAALGAGTLLLAAGVAFVAALVAATGWRWLAHRERCAWLGLWVSSLALAVLAYGRALPEPSSHARRSDPRRSGATHLCACHERRRNLRSDHGRWLGHPLLARLAPPATEAAVAAGERHATVA